MVDLAFDDESPEPESLASLESTCRLASEAKPLTEKETGVSLEVKASACRGNGPACRARHASMRP